MIGGLHPFKRTGDILNDTMSEAPGIHSNHVIATVAIRAHGNQNVSLGSLDSHPEVLRGVIGQSCNDGIGMNPPGTIGGNLPQGTRRGS